VASFSEALWLELKPSGVRVLNVCPGLVKTGFGLAAGMRDFRTHPLADSPQLIVDSAFRALKRNAPTIIPGWKNRLQAFVEQLMPRRLLLFLVDSFQKTQGKNKLNTFIPKEEQSQAYARHS